MDYEEFMLKVLLGIMISLLVGLVIFIVYAIVTATPPPAEVQREWFLRDCAKKLPYATCDENWELLNGPA